MPLLTITRLTIHEAARRRLVLATALLTVLVIALTGWGFSRLPLLQEHGAPISRPEELTVASVLLIMVTYMFSFILAIGASFLASPAIASDIDSGLLLAILPRPIRRADVVLGKWLGLACLLTVYAAGAGGLELLAVKLTTGYVPPQPLLTLAFLVGESLVLLTLSLLISTRLAPIIGGIIALVLFGVAWMAGIASAIGVAVSNTALINAGTLISLLLPTDGLWRGALFNLEPATYAAATGASTAARANPFAVSAPPPGAFVAWSVVWIVLVLGAASVSFARRDL